MWLEQRIIAERTIEGYDSVLRIHINPAFGAKHLNVIRCQDIKSLVAVMRRKVPRSRMSKRVRVKPERRGMRMPSREAMCSWQSAGRNPRSNESPGMASSAGRLPSYSSTRSLTRRLRPL
ncbi:hypothetical protein [Acrocarpospora pleiomorpha]|uniref:hypothetical protein n=1 Tax=Acrocarpospora pleiomorpha TaxID=90975 RepID=UPI001C3FF5C4